MKLKKVRTAGRTPIGYRKIFLEDGVHLTSDLVVVKGLQLARVLASTGKFSIREISKEVAKYGVVGRDGKPLLPGTLWRILERD